MLAPAIIDYFPIIRRQISLCITYAYEDVDLHIFTFFTCLRVQIIGDVRGRGMFFGIDLVKDRETREPHTAAAAHILGVLKQVDNLIFKYKINRNN